MEMPETTAVRIIEETPRRLKPARREGRGPRAELRVRGRPSRTPSRPRWRRSACRSPRCTLSPDRLHALKEHTRRSMSLVADRSAARRTRGSCAEGRVRGRPPRARMLHMAVLRSPHAHHGSAGATRRGGARPRACSSSLRRRSWPRSAARLHPADRHARDVVRDLPDDTVLYVGQPVAASWPTTRTTRRTRSSGCAATTSRCPRSRTSTSDEHGAPRLHDDWPKMSPRGVRSSPAIPTARSRRRDDRRGHVHDAATRAAPIEAAPDARRVRRDTAGAERVGSRPGPHLYRTVLAASLGIEETRIVVIVRTWRRLRREAQLISGGRPRRGAAMRSRQAVPGSRRAAGTSPPRARASSGCARGGLRHGRPHVALEATFRGRRRASQHEGAGADLPTAR